MGLVRTPTLCAVGILQCAAIVAQSHVELSLANEQLVASPYGHLAPVNRDPLSKADWFITPDAFPSALATAFVNSGWALPSDFTKAPARTSATIESTIRPDSVPSVLRSAVQPRKIVHASMHAKPKAPVWVEMPSILQPTWR